MQDVKWNCCQLAVDLVLENSLALLALNLMKIHRKMNLDVLRFHYAIKKISIVLGHE